MKTMLPTPNPSRWCDPSRLPTTAARIICGRMAPILTIIDGPARSHISLASSHQLLGTVGPIDVVAVAVVRRPSSLLVAALSLLVLPLIVPILAL